MSQFSGIGICVNGPCPAGTLSSLPKASRHGDTVSSFRLLGQAHKGLFGVFFLPSGVQDFFVSPSDREKSWKTISSFTIYHFK